MHFFDVEENCSRLRGAGSVIKHVFKVSSNFNTTVVKPEKGEALGFDQTPDVCFSVLHARRDL